MEFRFRHLRILFASPVILEGQTFGRGLFVERIHEESLGSVDEESFAGRAQLHLGSPFLASLVDREPHLLLGILEQVVIVGLLFVVHDFTHRADAIIFTSSVLAGLLRANVARAAELADLIFLLLGNEVSCLDDTC